MQIEGQSPSDIASQSMCVGSSKPSLSTSSSSLACRSSAGDWMCMMPSVPLPTPDDSGAGRQDGGLKIVYLWNRNAPEPGIRYPQMRGDHKRVPLEDAYALALGRAVFIFAKLEWSAISCCER